MWPREYSQIQLIPIRLNLYSWQCSAMWVTRSLFKLVPLPQPQDSPETPQASVLSQGCPAPNAPFSVLPSRFSNMAGMPEVQELKRAAELRSQLRTVSGGERGGGRVRSRAEGRGPARLPAEP